MAEEKEDLLPKIVKFEGSNMSSYDSVEHAAYQKTQYESVKAVDQTKLKMPATLMPTWEKNVHKEVQINEEASRSLVTIAQREKDAERDRLLTNIFYVVRGHMYSPVKAKAEAAARLDNVLRPYAGLPQQAFDKETLSILGLEDDLAKHTDDITAVGLTDTVAALHTANEEYEELRLQRRSEQVKSKLPPMSQIRPKTDAAYEVVCQYIQSAYLTAANDDDRATIEALVALMNKTSADFKAAHNQSLAQKRAAKEPKDPNAPKKPKDPKTPEKPKDPKDPKQPEKPKDPEQPKDPKKPGGDDGNPDIHLPEE